MSRTEAGAAQPMERVVVLGASGGCGAWVVRLAAARGWSVKAVVRPGTRVAFGAGVEVCIGDPGDVRLLDELLTGATAVISALGLRRAGRSPWARLLSPPDLTASVTARLLPVMAWHGVRRLLAISAGGVGESRSRLSWGVQRLVSSGNIGVAYHDLARMEAQLAASDLDWRVVRPVTLIDGAPTGRAREVERYGLLSLVRRGDVAAHLVDAVARRDAVAPRAVLLGS